MALKSKDDATSGTIADADPILEKLTIIARSLGVLALRMSPRHLKTDTDRIVFLASLGFDRNEIASMLGIAAQTVSNRLSEKKIIRR